MQSPTKASIQEALKEGLFYLKEHNVESPRLESEILLSHAMQKDRSWLIIHQDEPVIPEALKKFRSLLQKKITGIPTAYLLGVQEFYGRDFKVGPAVLIPRPETEELVEWIVNSGICLKKILDMGTGSGCLGITLCLQAHVEEAVLADISTDALRIAGINGKMVRSLDQPPEKSKEKKAEKTKITLVESDLFSQIKDNDFDLVVSNPPYILQEEFNLLEKSVKDFEPQKALLLPQPESFNDDLVKGAYRCLRPGGWLYLETNPLLINSLVALCKKNGFEKTEVKKDLSQKERFIRACKK